MLHVSQYDTVPEKPKLKSEIFKTKFTIVFDWAEYFEESSMFYCKYFKNTNI